MVAGSFDGVYDWFGLKDQMQHVNFNAPKVGLRALTIWDMNSQQMVEESTVDNPYMFTGRR